MSQQRHTHPTQSVAPGADPEQEGLNPPPQWVNPAQAAAAEFEPHPQDPRYWPPDDAVTGPEAPE